MTTVSPTVIATDLPLNNAQLYVPIHEVPNLFKLTRHRLSTSFPELVDSHIGLCENTFEKYQHYQTWFFLALYSRNFQGS